MREPNYEVPQLGPKYEHILNNFVVKLWKLDRVTVVEYCHLRGIRTWRVPTSTLIWKLTNAKRRELANIERWFNRD